MKFIHRIGKIFMNHDRRYDQSYYIDNHLGNLNSGFGFLFRWYYRYIARYIMAGPAGINDGKVLDVGCGVGALVREFNNIGFEAVGVDVNDAAIENSVYAKCSLVKTSAQLDFPDNNFDLVVSREVLEHIEKKEIDSCIREWDRVCKGKMVHIIAVEERGPSAVNDPMHVNVQKEEWWKNKFAEHGYKAVRPRRLFWSPFGSSGYFMFVKASQHHRQ